MQTLDKHFQALTKAAFARHGFAYGELLARWPAIMGEVADFAVPEKIRWPKGAGEEARKLGGTLVLRAAPGRALDLQYQAPFIIERVNAYLGHGAIVSLKVMQGPVAKKAARPPKPALAAPQEIALEARLAPIGDEPLKDALRRLGAGALAGLRSPQAK